MNVASNSQACVSQEFAMHEVDGEFEVDEEGEGLVDAPKGRSANYTMEDDVLLFRSWCKVGMDPITAANQTRDTCWVEIKEMYDKKNRKRGCERTDRSRRSRWSTINIDCSKWSGVLTVVDKMSPSGTNDKDRVSSSMLSIFVLFHVHT
jgi:hypothetical protein